MSSLLSSPSLSCIIYCSGFGGSITPKDNAGTAFTAAGIATVELSEEGGGKASGKGGPTGDCHTLTITELPLGRWTQDYKQMLCAMITGETEKKDDDDKGKGGGKGGKDAKGKGSASGADAKGKGGKGKAKKGDDAAVAAAAAAAGDDEAGAGKARAAKAKAAAKKGG